jgi:hypothetical protein
MNATSLLIAWTLVLVINVGDSLLGPLAAKTS